MTSNPLSVALFEQNIVDALCKRLNLECSSGTRFDSSPAFESEVRRVLQTLLDPYNLEIDFAPHPQVFPDIVLGEFGIEIKFTASDTWRSIANSVFESTRSSEVRHIYVVFGKMGGSPMVHWARYEDSVIHVRTSHVPRYEVEMYPFGRERSRPSLFELFGIRYEDFSRLTVEERMRYIRNYARGRLKAGEHLWWIEDQPEGNHSLPLEVRLYTHLPQDEKRRFRAEAALLCPQIVRGSRSRGKYDDAVMYLLTYHGVLCSQARDLFSAGSVALRSDSTRGGIYIMRALKDIEEEMKTAALYLEDALFLEYWGESVPATGRVTEWLKRADNFANDWKPSNELFVEDI